MTKNGIAECVTDPYYPEALIYETKQGEKVRSKSEMLIADAYYELGIPYRYEAKLDLKNGIYPGKNLIVTYETREIPINVKSLKRMFRELFLP